MDGSSDSWSAGQLPTADSGLKEMNYSTLGLAMGVYCVQIVWYKQVSFSFAFYAWVCAGIIRCLVLS